MRVKDQKKIDDLGRALRRIDGRGYAAYREIQGAWILPGFALDVRHVQRDPFAPPSRMAVVLSPEQAGFPPGVFATASRRTGLSCFLARRFAQAARGARRVGGHGRSGEIAMTDPGQVVLPNTAVQVGRDGSLEARFTVGLPAYGRKALGRAAERLLGEELPALVNATLRAASHDPVQVARHAEAAEDADALRDQLPDRGLVAFVADGSLLPRRSGTDDRPFAQKEAVLFESPATLSVVLDRPNGPPVRGMGVRRGTTLLVGGGYHGKSTLLDAVARGVYNHRPGDGRELVVADPAATKVQAEEGRPVAGVDISPFVGGLPDGQDTKRFSTSNASGSTSQAASVIEAIEAGSRFLLVDEDTAAANFMTRDRRMQELIRSRDEPITPFVDRVRSLCQECGASVLVVVGGSGEYLDVADLVIGMVRYRPLDLTARAKEVAAAHPTGRRSRKVVARWPARNRCPNPASVRPERGRRRQSIRVRDRRAAEFGRQRIDLSGVSQIVSTAQARAVALAVAHARAFMGREQTVEDVLKALRASLAENGLDVLDPHGTGELAAPRMQDVAAALNRHPTLSLHAEARR